MNPRLVIIRCAGYIFRQLFLQQLYNIALSEMLFQILHHAVRPNSLRFPRVLCSELGWVKTA